MICDPLILGFDTSAAHCAAALLSGDRVLLSRAEEMTRGQAERLMPLIQDLLDACDTTWRDLQAIGVGVGPGNFTGIRISVSAARGLALGLGVPAYGIDGFAVRRETSTGLASVPATRDMHYVDMGEARPEMLTSQALEQRAAGLGLRVAEQPAPRQAAEIIARLARQRWPDQTLPPAPLYVRPADAAPSRDLPPVLLD